MAKQFFKVDGLKELETAFSEIDIGTRAAAIRDDLKQSSAPVLSAMKEKSPFLSGDLRSSLGMRTSVGSGGKRRATVAKVLIGITNPKHKHVKGQAVAIEYGTRRHAAQPFIRNALLDEGQNVLRNFQFRTWVRIKGIRVPLARKGRK